MLQDYLMQIRDLIWGLPLLGFVVGTGVITTVGLGFIQFKKFFSSWELIFAPAEGGIVGEINPLQAFLKALSTSLGNGSIAGIATALHAGGPGAAFWIFFIGFLGMILRFCEVYLATSFSGISKTGRALGGPFLYLQRIPGGAYLPHVYALLCLGYGLSSGTAMQGNSISSAITEMVAIPTWIIGIALVGFIFYILMGGAHRIVKANVYIVPVKVLLFFTFCGGVLVYHWASLGAALVLMCKSALNPQAFAGGVMGLTVQYVFRLSLTRTINASEAGLGTAAVIYGSTGSKDPLRNGLSAMLGTFISVNLVCTMVALAIVASGSLASGHTGSALTSVAFQSVFGAFGGWVVTLLSVLFGVGVFVAYGFVGRQCWLFLTNDRFEHVFTFLFCAITFWGAVADVSVVWAAVDVVNGGCLLINLFGILWLLPYMRSHILPILKKEG